MEPTYRPARYSIELTAKITLSWEEGEFPQNGDVTPQQQLKAYAEHIDAHVLPDTQSVLDMFGDHYDNARDLWDNSMKVLEVTSQFEEGDNQS